MVVVTLFNELVYVFSVLFSRDKTHSSVLAEDFCFNLCHEDDGKSDRHFSAHGGSVRLKVVAFHELE